MKKAIRGAPRQSIVTIGGGNIRTRETLAIDREIIRLSGKKSPKVLFIPTASSDDADYWHSFQAYYGGFLHCRVEALLLIANPPSRSQIARKIAAADIVYVGGGNTLMMMRWWRRLGVDAMLKQAWESGTVMAGLSAGSICWFESGHSDSMSYYNPRHWKYIRVKGLGLIQATHCPHYNGQTKGVPRRRAFRDMMARTPGLGIAIENNCAMAFVHDGHGGGRYRVISSRERAQAYRVYKREGKVIARRIPKPGAPRQSMPATWEPIASLYLK